MIIIGNDVTIVVSSQIRIDATPPREDVITRRRDALDNTVDVAPVVVLVLVVVDAPMEEVVEKSSSGQSSRCSSN
jgi:hypothetical protein